MTTPSMPGLEIDFSAQIAASLDGIAAALTREQQWRQRQMQVIRQIPFAGAITLAGGAGTDDQPDKLQAKTGYIWGIRRLTANGFTAGTVTAYRNSSVGEPIMPFPVPAVNTIGRGELLLMPGDRIVWGATGITGTVSYWGVADCFESWYLPYYLG
jgi:hypothetical protein